MKILSPTGLILMLLWPAHPAGAATLLGSTAYQQGGGTTSASFTDVRSVAIEFGYSSSTLGTACSIPMLGCDGIPVASLVPGAVFTFDATHGTYFALLASKLTDGIDEPVYFASQLRNASGAILFAAGAGGAAEKIPFGRSTDFAGQTISSITLTINGFELDRSSTSCGSMGEPGGLEFCVDAVWSVYGPDGPSPAMPASWGFVKSIYR